MIPALPSFFIIRTGHISSHKPQTLQVSLLMFIRFSILPFSLFKFFKFFKCLTAPQFRIERRPQRAAVRPSLVRLTWEHGASGSEPLLGKPPAYLQL